MSKRPFAKRRALKQSVEALESRIAPATLFIVTSTADSGLGSLRAAVANSASGDEIDFAANLSGMTITLSSAEILIDHSLTIHGLDNGSITIAGDGGERIFNVQASGANVEIDHLTLTNGAGVSGGAIYVASGALTIDHSIITGNTAQADGGGIYVSNQAGAFVLSNSTVSNNMATDDGGGLSVFNSDAQITNCTISGNEAGTGSEGFGTHTGGGLNAFLINGSAQKLVVSNSTISGNTAPSEGGGVFLALYGASSQATFENVTISGNHAGHSGGGIYLSYSAFADLLPAAAPSSPLIIRNSTIAFNQVTSPGFPGGGIYLNTGELTLASTISSNNTDLNLTAPTLIAGNPSDLFNNAGTVNAIQSLILAPTGGQPINGTNTSNIIGEDPNLGPLQNNGGPTLTHALTTGSVALDAGNNSAGLEFDQRGAGFDRVFGETTDIGAFEFQGAMSAPDLNVTKTSPLATYHNGDTIDYSIVVKNNGTATASGVSLLETLPANTTFNAADNPNWVLSGSQYTFSVSNLVSGATASTVHFIVHVNSSVPPATDTLSNTVIVSDDGSHGRDTNPNDNTATENDGFTPVTIDLAVTKTSAKSSYVPGEAIAYSITVKNNGTGDAGGVVLTENLPANTSFDATGNAGWTLVGGTQYSYTLGALSAGATATAVPFHVHVDPALPIGAESLSNHVSVTDDHLRGVDTNAANNDFTETDTLVADAVLHVSIVDDIAKTVARGGLITYTISYSNTGNQAENVSLVEHPANHTDYTETPVGWSYNFVDLAYHFDLGTLAAGASGQKTFQVQLGSSFPTSQRAVTDSVDIVRTMGKSPDGAQATDTTASVDTLLYQGIEVFTAGVATRPTHAESNVRVIDLALKAAGLPGAEIDFRAYGKNVRDSFRTAVYDFNGDGFDDVIIIPEHGTGGVKVFDGTTGTLLDSKLNGLQPFGKKTGGFVEALTQPSFGEGRDTHVVYFGSSLSGGMLKAYDADSGEQIGATILPFESVSPHFRGGVRVAAGDVDGDGRLDLIAAQGNFGHTVNVYHNGDLTDLLGSFTTPGKFNGGFNIGAGDLNGDGRAEILLGHNRLSAPIVEIWSYQRPVSGVTATGTFVFDTSFTAFATKYQDGVRPSVGDHDLDGHLDIVVGTGYRGKSMVSIFSVIPDKLASTITVASEPIASFKAFPKLTVPGFWGSISDPLPVADGNNQM